MCRSHYEKPHTMQDRDITHKITKEYFFIHQKWTKSESKTLPKEQECL